MRAALALLLTFAALVGSREADAMSAPDSTRLPALDETYRHASPLRLQTESETIMLGSCRADAEGIHGIERRGGFGSLSGPRDSARLVRWQDIEGVERGRTNIGLGVGLGAVAGLALGIVSAHEAARGPGLEGLAGSLAAPGIIISSGALGVLLGAAFGAASHTWEPLAPPGVAESTGARGRRRGPRSGYSITEPAR